MTGHPVLHIFYVQAYVPALIAESIVKNNSLPEADVLIWSARNKGKCWLPINGNIRDLEKHPFRFSRIFRSWNPASTWARLKMLDVQIASATQGRRFHLYIPHSYYQFFQLASTHPLCAEFNYLEEGLAAYREPHDLAESFREFGEPLWSLSAFQKKILSRRMQGSAFFNNKAACAFGVGADSFKFQALRRVKVDVAWRTADLGSIYDDCALVLLLPIGHCYAAKHGPNRYAQALKELVAILEKSPYRKIFIKKHPESKDRDFIQFYQKVFGSLGSRFEADPSEHPPEVVCASARVTVISAGSSVALYAPAMGTTVLSYSGIVAEYCPDFGRRWLRIKGTLGEQIEATDIREVSWLA